MLRKFVFGSILSFSFMTECCQAMAADGLLFEKTNNRYVRVYGNHNDVVAFMFRYQDALWADWRSNKRTAAIYAKHENRIRESGFVELYVGCNITRKAFTESIR